MGFHFRKTVPEKLQEVWRAPGGEETTGGRMTKKEPWAAMGWAGLKTGRAGSRCLWGGPLGNKGVWVPREDLPLCPFPCGLGTTLQFHAKRQHKRIKATA